MEIDVKAIKALKFSHGELSPIDLPNPVKLGWDRFWDAIQRNLGEISMVEFGSFLVAFHQRNADDNLFLLGKTLHGNVIFIGRVWNDRGEAEPTLYLTSQQIELLKTIELERKE